MTLNSLEQKIINYLALANGEYDVTAMDLAVLFREGEVTKGFYHPISQAVASLRRKGLLADVAQRCPHCNSALTRGQKNVPLRLTSDGLQSATKKAA